ncbi:MAG: hypothetical protein GEV28_17175 [Actinophytocola sp.]|uniref:hypothetical protein n=1 Tax=Actinophytocola sp. TaxID=1872138 RepID=UPI001329FA06|nr:hypothetical protein [Actinophytocola sp.]MPZ82023.1 hypothetical protein [Actinophytocola sp.]
MYVDPNASTPNTQPTTTGAGTGVGGMIGSSLDGLVEAATTGRLRVDQATGDATIKALTDIQDEVNRYVRRGGSVVTVGTRLGGGYAEQIDRFIQDWTSTGANSAVTIMNEYVKELERLKEAVRKSMATYEQADEGGAAHINAAGPTR